MQTSFSSRLSSSRQVFSDRGFSLVELLVSAAIITIVAGIILARFNSFDGTILIKSFAYEVATALREAQIYSLSVVNTGTGTSAGYRYPYGVSFTPGARGYVFYRYNNASTSVPPRYETAEVSVIQTITSSTGMEVYDVCVTHNSGVEDCSLSRLDISFRRPDFSAIFYSPTIGSPSTLASAKIILQSTKNTANKWIVEIKLLGQIVVYKQ